MQAYGYEYSLLWWWTVVQSRGGGMQGYARQSVWYMLRRLQSRIRGVLELKVGLAGLQGNG